MRGKIKNKYQKLQWKIVWHVDNFQQTCRCISAQTYTHILV